MKEQGDDRIKSATFFTTLVDFSEPGELGVFMDEQQLAALEKIMAKRGYLDGARMAASFNLLRASDLIWSFVINNYLLGKDPFPFDLLYWNSDNTRMPAAMHSFYLRKCYHENVLVRPGGISLGGVPIDLTRIDLPVYWVSTKEDHIAPWRSIYAATQLYQLAFLPLADRTNWVAWTPDGFYAATPGAHGVLRWLVNRGWGQAGRDRPGRRHRRAAPARRAAAGAAGDRHRQGARAGRARPRPPGRGTAHQQRRQARGPAPRGRGRRRRLQPGAGQASAARLCR